MQNRISGRDGPLQNGTDSYNLASLWRTIRDLDVEAIDLATIVLADAPTLGNTATLWSRYTGHNYWDTLGNDAYSVAAATIAADGTQVDANEATYRRTRFPWMGLLLYADQNSAAGGLTFEANLDGGSLWVPTAAAQTYSAADGATLYTFRNVRPQMRIRYVGGGVTPAVFWGYLMAYRSNPGI